MRGCAGQHGGGDGEFLQRRERQVHLTVAQHAAEHVDVANHELKHLQHNHASGQSCTSLFTFPESL